MTSQFSPLSLTMQTGNQVEVVITYMEQSARPALPPAPFNARRKTALLRAENPPVHFYRYLYDLIGEPYNWISRRRLSDKELAALIQHEDVYIYILYVDGVPAGMAEVDGRGDDMHELKFFGLTPDFIGAGLGRYFLSNVLDLIWSRGPRRVRLETCSLDHPAALPLYQKFGFSVIDRRKGFVELLCPGDSGKS